MGKPELLDAEQIESLHYFLSEHHRAFCLDPGEREEKELEQLTIDMGDAAPKKQPARWMPLAVWQEGETSEEHARN